MSITYRESIERRKKKKKKKKKKEKEKEKEKRNLNFKILKKIYFYNYIIKNFQNKIVIKFKFF